MITIAIDAMSGDSGLKATIPGALRALKAHDDLRLILVGQEELIKRILKRFKVDNEPRLEIQQASEVIKMDESPSLALRNKKDSSLRVAINLVKEGRAQACVSSGNTGALMATARFVLKMIPGIDRPAIIYGVPGVDLKTNEPTLTHVLDLGANIDCTAQNLFEFALMGSVLVNVVEEVDSPRVALLNIGEEEMKGLESIKEAARLLHDCPAINYVGFVEGNDLFFNKADVIVCDGFIGNIALKTMEGTAKFISCMVKEAFGGDMFSKMQSILALPVLYKLKQKLDPRKYNGATFLGLKGIVVKSHGGSDGMAFASAINAAVNEVRAEVPSKIQAQIEKFLANNQSNPSGAEHAE